MLINAGTMKNDGMEVLLNVVPVKTENLQWNSGFTYSTNRNNLVSLDNDQFKASNDFFDAGYTGEPIQVATHRVKVGEPIGRFYVWKSVGVDQNGGWLVENKDGEVIPIADATRKIASIMVMVFQNTSLAGITRYATRTLIWL